MVALLAGLKWQLIRNGLRRNTAALVGLVVGGLYGLAILGVCVAGLVALRFVDDPSLSRTVVTVGGSALTLGWAVVPVLTYGLDQTLDPARFATFAIPRRQLLLGMLVAALVGVPAFVTAVIALATVVTWSFSAPAALVAAVSAVVGLLTCVALSRAVTTAASSLLRTRRVKELGGALVGVAGLTVAILAPRLTDGGLITRRLLTDTARVLGWTPLGLAWTAPADVAEGAVGTGLLRLLLACVFLVLVLLAWEPALRRAMEDPRGVAPGRGVSHHGLGWFARMPASPAGAVAARAVTYWRRDPRYLTSTGMLVLVPLLVGLPALSGGRVSVAALAMGPLAGWLMGWGMHNDLAYDGTAFWAHVAAGVPGRADRLGRLVPVSALAVVAVPVYTLLGSALTGRWAALPATFGLSLVFLLGGFGCSSIVSVVKPYPVPQPGESPFNSPTGAVGVTLLVQLVVGSVLFALASPVLVTALLGIFGPHWWVWVTLPLGAVLGLAYLLLGIRIGSGVYERRSPDLLAELSRIR